MVLVARLFVMGYMVLIGRHGFDCSSWYYNPGAYTHG